MIFFFILSGTMGLKFTSQMGVDLWAERIVSRAFCCSLVLISRYRMIIPTTSHEYEIVSFMKMFAIHRWMRGTFPTWVRACVDLVSCFRVLNSNHMHELSEVMQPWHLSANTSRVYVPMSPCVFIRSAISQPQCLEDRFA